MPEGWRFAELTAGAEVCGGHQGVDAPEGLGTRPQRAPASRPGQGEVGCCCTSSQICTDKLAPASSPCATHTNCGAFPQDQNQSLQPYTVILFACLAFPYISHRQCRETCFSWYGHAHVHLSKLTLSQSELSPF